MSEGVAVGLSLALPAAGLALVFFVLELANIIKAWRSGSRNGLISPCRGYVYRNGKWYPREVER